MNGVVTQIFPPTGKEQPLIGLYLGHDLRQYVGSSGSAFVYSSFVASLDGRIAIPHPTRPGMVVPDQTANPRDWRLFQELAVQADVLITSGRYLRDYADGRAQEILRVYDHPQFADLKEWRVERGLQPQPDLAVISGSLDFPIPEPLLKGERSVLVFTTSQADDERVKALQAQTGHVIIAGEKSVDGHSLVENLSNMGYRLVFSATGPKVMHLLLAAGVLNRLYLTSVCRLLGGQPFSSIVEGVLFDPPMDLRLNTLYYDPQAFQGVGQLFASYDRVSLS